MFSLFRFEVKYYFKNLKEAIQLIALFISIVILYPFTKSGMDIEYQHLATSILWIALIMATNMGSATLFQRDRDNGRLEYYQLTRMPVEWVVLAKWAAYYLSILVPMAMVMPVAGILMGIPAAEWGHYVLGLALGAVPLSLIATMGAILMAGLERAGAMLSLVVLPLAIPVIIFGSSYFGAAADQQQESALFLIGFSVFLLPIICGAGASCIKASN